MVEPVARTLAVSRRGLIALGAASAGALLAGCDRIGLGGGTSAKPQFKSIDITGADYARDFDLLDTDGQRRTVANFKGNVLVVFFGFTQCPDVCPTTLVELAGIRKALGPDGQRVKGVFVTIDPERDTPEVLKAYVGNFGADFVALRGTPEQTQAAAKHFKVFYAKVPGKAEGSYTMDHTAQSYVFDPTGRIRLVARYGTGGEGLKHDLQLLLQGV